MTFAVGSLVRARGREWMVLPESENDLLILRPIGGGDAETTGIYLPLEPVEPAQFAPPSADSLGDNRSVRLLRDAIRLGIRSSAGPFRSFGDLNFSPRSYQLVPLLMALKLDPVRLLIADDVGIGKTVEALLIARELLARGEITRMAVLCPPHLAEQWQREMKRKFHIDAELLLSSTARKLERLPFGRSVFDAYPFLIVSTDYIKATNRRHEFLRSCPEFVIVDEAHTCAFGGASAGARHHRFELLHELSQDPNRHIVLVTATPHSGNDEAFRSLLSLLGSEFKNLPSDLRGDHNRKHRETLARQVVLRRRVDIKRYLNENTPFPEREEREEGYRLSPEYKQLFEQAIAYAIDLAGDQKVRSFGARVRWWSALALLRALASSPAAAEATFTARGNLEELADPETIDAEGQRQVLDLTDDAESIDIVPGADVGELAEDPAENEVILKKLRALARSVRGKGDKKLERIKAIVKDLQQRNFNPVIFCRFIATADYLAEELKSAVMRDTTLLCITGLKSPEEREAEIDQLDQDKPNRCVLVCTDCLSEGMNLQTHFDAVIHYDLAWNPTRHEQREGRVDRYGQEKTIVRVLTYYGLDNQIDGIVLDVLLRKHKVIRSSTGISVPIPVPSGAVMESIMEGLLLRRSNADNRQQFLVGFEEQLAKQSASLHTSWEKKGEEERESRSLFAQHSIRTETVEAELESVRRAVGADSDLHYFLESALNATGASVLSRDRTVTVTTATLPQTLRPLLPSKEELVLTPYHPAPEKAVLLTRTHPFVSEAARLIVEGALEGRSEAPAKRAGCVRTAEVTARTTLLVYRLRFHLRVKSKTGERELLAESVDIAAFRGTPTAPEWLSDDDALALLSAKPSGNVIPEAARDAVEAALSDSPLLIDFGNRRAETIGAELLAAHNRVRKESDVKGVTITVAANTPVDLLSITVYLPQPRV